MQPKELFEKVDYFAGLDDRVLRKVAAAAAIRHYGKNEVLVRQGSLPPGLFVIVRGRVTVARDLPGATSEVEELAAERAFGEMSLVDEAPSPVTVTAKEDTECMLLTRDSFVKLMQKHPEIPIRVARLLAERLRAAAERPLPAVPAPSERMPDDFMVEEGGNSTPATAEAALESGNGGRPDAKARIQDSLLSAFDKLYSMKAFTRFTVAVLGCPVEGTGKNIVDQIRVGDVKAILLPSREPQRMGIEALEPGVFTLHVYRPEHRNVVRFGPVPIQPGDNVALLLKNGNITLSKRQPCWHNGETPN